MQATSELANQRARKMLFTCVVYTDNNYLSLTLGITKLLIEEIFTLLVKYAVSTSLVRDEVNCSKLNLKK